MSSPSEEPAAQQPGPRRRRGRRSRRRGRGRPRPDATGTTDASSGDGAGPIATAGNGSTGNGSVGNGSAVATRSAGAPVVPHPSPPPRIESTAGTSAHEPTAQDSAMTGRSPHGNDGVPPRARRRRPRRRGRKPAGDATAAPQQPSVDGHHETARHAVEPAVPVEGRGRAGSGRARAAAANARARRGKRLRTVDETSAGGLVVDTDNHSAALIGRLDRKGRLLWSLPKGHLEAGETAEQAAIREVAEETGIDGRVIAPLGTIDYWFVAEDRRVHKTVHHFLMEAIGGELCDEDVEVTEVAWVPLAELEGRLAYADERKLVKLAAGLLAESA